MARLATALIAGLLFGFGLGVSHMVNPVKVLGFLDVAGAWDPSLALVMGGAVAVTLVTFRLILSRPQPVLEAHSQVPTLRYIDVRLVGGAATFGIGWGLVGYCPGPALSSFAYLMPESVIFVAAMLAGAALGRILPQVRAPGDAVSART